MVLYSILSHLMERIEYHLRASESGLLSTASLVLTLFPYLKEIRSTNRFVYNAVRFSAEHLEPSSCCPSSHHHHRQHFCVQSQVYLDFQSNNDFQHDICFRARRRQLLHKQWPTITLVSIVKQTTWYLSCWSWRYSSYAGGTSPRHLRRYCVMITAAVPKK